MKAQCTANRGQPYWITNSGLSRFFRVRGCCRKSWIIMYKLERRMSIAPPPRSRRRLAFSDISAQRASLAQCHDPVLTSAAGNPDGLWRIILSKDAAVANPSIYPAAAAAAAEPSDPPESPAETVWLESESPQNLKLTICVALTCRYLQVQNRKRNLRLHPVRADMIFVTSFDAFGQNSP